MPAVETYLVGMATVDITPPVGIKLAGYAARTDPSTGVYHPLRATAMAIDDGAQPLLLLSADWLGFYDRTAMTRQRLQAATGIPGDRLILCGTHTHCGPAIREADAEHYGPADSDCCSPMDYLERAVSAMADCAQRAWQTRSPARLRCGHGSCGFAASRRKPDGKGGIEWKPSLDAPHDHEVPVLAVETPASELRGVLFSYACHPTSRAGLLIGPDYPGFACDAIETHFPGVTACFVQGCGGDQKPNAVDPATGGFRQLEVDEVAAIGNQLGEAAAAVIDGGDLHPVTGPVTMTQTILDLRTEPPDRELYTRSLEDPHDFVRDWAQHNLDCLNSGETVNATVPFELQTIRCGDSLALVTLAGEMTVEHGLRLKRELAPHFSHVLVAAYANDIVGYVPVRRQIPEGGYEVWTAQQYHKRTGPYVAETEDQIHAAVHAALGVA